MPADSRAETLGKIRSALQSTGAQVDAQADWAAIARDYRRSSPSDATQIPHLLIDRLRDYDAQVLESDQENVAATIARMLHARGVTRVLVPAGLPANMLPYGFEFMLEQGLSAAEMNLCEGVLTGCTLAIAETGTLVLQNAARQGRRAASLVPDYHLCVVEASSIVATVPEAIARLQNTATLPTTFVSGPSATADIEMTRIKGVHGPRFLDVLIVRG